MKMLRSFGYAFRGIRHAWTQELSFRVQVIVAILVIITMLVLPVSFFQRLMLILMIAMVLVLEIFNTVVERISDILKPRVHPYVAAIKDLMAAAVLITSAAAAIIGLSILIPAFLLWIS